jgi:DNA-binding transcriptional LysR family regulator
LAAFHGRHPKVNLQLEVANTQEILAGVLDSRFTLGFVEGVIHDCAAATSTAAPSPSCKVSRKPRTEVPLPQLATQHRPRRGRYACWPRGPGTMKTVPPAPSSTSLAP